MAFLDHLERQRHNSVRSRNARLAALRSFLKFAAHRDVSSLQVIERALGVPVKRFERPMFGYLSREEMLAVIGTPDESWLSQRDHVLFLLMYNTGARVSEIIGIKVGDVVLDEQCCLRPSARQGAQAAQCAAVALDREGSACMVASESGSSTPHRHCCPTGMVTR